MHSLAAKQQQQQLSKSYNGDMGIHEMGIQGALVYKSGLVMGQHLDIIATYRRHRYHCAFHVKKVKERIAVNGYSISQLRDVTCHIGSHSVTCYPTQVNAPPALTPAGKLVLDLPTLEGWKAVLT